MSQNVLIGLPLSSGFQEKITRNVHRSGYPWLVGSCHCGSSTSIDSTTGATPGFCTRAREHHNCQRFCTCSLLSTAPNNVVRVPPLDRCWQCKQLVRFWSEIGVVDRLNKHLETCAIIEDYLGLRPITRYRWQRQTPWLISDFWWPNLSRPSLNACECSKPTITRSVNGPMKTLSCSHWVALPSKENVWISLRTTG